MICNAHWRSDVDAVRIMGAATIAKLHSNAELLSDIKAARKEVKAAKAKGIAASFWMRARTTASRAATGCLSSCQASSSSPVLTDHR